MTSWNYSPGWFRCLMSVSILMIIHSVYSYGIFLYFEFTKWGPFQVWKQEKACRFLVKSLKMSESSPLNQKHGAEKVGLCCV